MLRPEFARSWHEAVAVVQEVAAGLTPGLGLPAPQDVLFDEGGGLSFGFGSEGGGNPVTGLALLLQGLLDGTEAPSGLADLAAENAVASPAHASLDGFVRALAFYERPNRATDVAAVAGRLRAVGGRQQSDDEFARLREKVAARADQQPQVTPDEKAKRRAGVTGRQKAMLAAAAAALLLVAAAGMSRNQGGLGGLMTGAELRFTGLVSSALERLGFGTPTADELMAAETPETSGPAEAEVGAPVSASAQRTSTPAASVTSATRAPRKDLVLPAVVRDEGGAVQDDGPVAMIEFATGEPLDVPAMVPDDLAVYTLANAEVRPPTFLRPQLPREPAADEDTGYFDIVVNEQGYVEQVKLLSPARRFQERMLVAAAKAWKFAPARLEGRPVRYRMRVPIILKGLP